MSIRRTPEQIARAVAGRIGCTVDELAAHESRREAWCGGCRRWLDEVDDFAADMSRSSGRQSYCKPCKARLRAGRVQSDGRTGC